VTPHWAQAIFTTVAPTATIIMPFFSPNHFVVEIDRRQEEPFIPSGTLDHVSKHAKPGAFRQQVHDASWD